MFGKKKKKKEKKDKDDGGDDDDGKKKKKKKDDDDAENGKKEKKKSKKPTPLVGEVLEVKAVPKKDRARVATVKVGQEEVEIVTTAPNVHLSCAGKKFIVALPGVTTENGIEVKVAKVAGVESSGMFCGPKAMRWSTDLLDAELAVQLDDAAESGVVPPSYDDAVAALKEREKAAAAEQARGKKGKKGGKAAKEDDEDLDALLAEFKDPNAEEKAEETGKKGKKKDKGKQKATDAEDFEAALADAKAEEKEEKEEAAVDAKTLANRKKKEKKKAKAGGGGDDDEDF